MVAKPLRLSFDIEESDEGERFPEFGAMPSVLRFQDESPQLRSPFRLRLKGQRSLLGIDLKEQVRRFGSPMPGNDERRTNDPPHLEIL